jgi:hypothetical protein
MVRIFQVRGRAMSKKGGESMENGDYRKREIEFTSLKNIITYCAMINQKSFDLYSMAGVLNMDYEFLKQWGCQNRWLINRVLRQYREEITEETKRRSVEGEGQGGNEETR